MSIIEIKKILNDTQNTLTERKSAKFIDMQTKIQIKKLKNENPTPEATISISKFEKEK